MIPHHSTNANVVILDALRDQVRDKLRSFLHTFKSLLKQTKYDQVSKDIADRITFILSLENGFLWDDSYASRQLDRVSQDGMFKESTSKIVGPETWVLPEVVQEQNRYSTFRPSYRDGGGNKPLAPTPTTTTVPTPPPSSVINPNLLPHAFPGLASSFVGDSVLDVVAESDAFDDARSATDCVT